MALGVYPVYIYISYIYIPHIILYIDIYIILYNVIFYMAIELGSMRSSNVFNPWMFWRPIFRQAHMAVSSRLLYKFCSHHVRFLAGCSRCLWLHQLMSKSDCPAWFDQMFRNSAALSTLTKTRQEFYITWPHATTVINPTCSNQQPYTHTWG